MDQYGQYVEDALKRLPHVDQIDERSQRSNSVNVWKTNGETRSLKFDAKPRTWKTQERGNPEPQIGYQTPNMENQRKGKPGSSNWIPNPEPGKPKKGETRSLNLDTKPRTWRNSET